MSGKSFQSEEEQITVSQALFFTPGFPSDVAGMLANSCFLPHHILRLPGQTVLLERNAEVTSKVTLTFCPVISTRDEL